MKHKLLAVVALGLWFDLSKNTALSSMNPRSGHLFDQASQRRCLNQVSSHILPYGEKTLETNEILLKIQWRANIFHGRINVL